MSTKIIVVALALTSLTACSGTRGNTAQTSRELQAQGAMQAGAQDSRSEPTLPRATPEHEKRFNQSCVRFNC